MSNKNLSLTEKNQTNAKQSHYEVILDNETTCITFHHIKPGEGTAFQTYNCSISQITFEKREKIVIQYLNQYDYLPKNLRVSRPKCDI